MKFDIPGRTAIDINILVLDLNGTLTIDGALVAGIAEKIAILKDQNLDIRLFTGDTLGTGGQIAAQLGLALHITPDSKAKADQARALRPTGLAAIGNGAIDLELFSCTDLRICTLQGEGIYAPLLQQTEILVTNIIDALDLFINKNRLIATLRT